MAQEDGRPPFRRTRFRGPPFAWRRHLPPTPPPWWPEGEPWPPTERHHLRHRMVGRVVGLLVMLFAISVVGCTLLVWITAQAVGLISVPAAVQARVPVVLITVLVAASAGMWLGARSLRRMTAPAGDLIDASERLAEGDFTVRVKERGPREVRALIQSFNGMAERLRAHEERRRNLLADVTHELRTPLAVMQGNLEGLLDGIYPRDDEHLLPILDETRILARLIEDLRTLSLVEAGALQLRKEPTDLTALAGETVASFRAQADRAGVTLAAEVPDEPAALVVDPARLREVLANLIGNALRYTPAGGRVTVRVQCTDAAVTLQVVDTGSGIAPEELAHIFDRFYKSRDSRGTGLGLTIARDLVAAHGGTLAAESAPGAGTRMTVTLPRRE